MSEYLLEDTHFVQIRDQANIFEKTIVDLNLYQFDFVIMLFGFYVIRYVFPNALLGNDQSIKAGFTVAFFFALFGYIRSHMLDYKKRLDITF